jgi:hypothetical protein
MQVGHLQGSGLIYWLPPLPKLSCCRDMVMDEASSLGTGRVWERHIGDLERHRSSNCSIVCAAATVRRMDAREGEGP